MYCVVPILVYVGTCIGAYTKVGKYRYMQVVQGRYRYLTDQVLKIHSNILL